MREAASAYPKVLHGGFLLNRNPISMHGRDLPSSPDLHLQVLSAVPAAYRFAQHATAQARRLMVADQAMAFSARSLSELTP